MCFRNEIVLKHIHTMRMMSMNETAIRAGDA